MTSNFRDMAKYFLGKITAASVKEGGFRLRFRVRFVGIRAVELSEKNGQQARGWLSDQLESRKTSGLVMLRILSVDDFGRAICAPVPKFDMMPEPFVGGRAAESVRMPDFLARLNYVVDGDTADFSIDATAALFAGMSDWEMKSWFRAAVNPSREIGGYLVRFVGLNAGKVTVSFGEKTLLSV